MKTVFLSDEEFGRTFVAPMRDVTESADPVVDIWPYVLGIPPKDLNGLAFREGEVEYVYRSGDGRFDQVLVATSAANIYIVVVVDRVDSAIQGHHVLDLNEKYSLKPPPSVVALSLAREICAKQNVVPDMPIPGATLGIALATLDLDPLNGLRHPAEGATSGWYVWGGEDLSQDSDFFEPMHVSHLYERCPAVLPYLALPPGWRFLLGANGHVDVWYDEQLLAT